MAEFRITHHSDSTKLTTDIYQGSQLRNSFDMQLISGHDDIRYVHSHLKHQ